MPIITIVSYDYYGPTNCIDVASGRFNQGMILMDVKSHRMVSSLPNNWVCMEMHASFEIPYFLILSYVNQ